MAQYLIIWSCNSCTSRSSLLDCLAMVRCHVWHDLSRSIFWLGRLSDWMMLSQPNTSKWIDVSDMEPGSRARWLQYNLEKLQRWAQEFNHEIRHSRLDWSSSSFKRMRLMSLDRRPLQNQAIYSVQNGRIGKTLWTQQMSSTITINSINY